jgi:gluconolactonase
MIHHHCSTRLVLMLLTLSLAACTASHDLTPASERRRDQNQRAARTDAGAGLSMTDIGAPVPIEGNFLFPEGPVWSPQNEVLYFSDINADAISQLTLPDTIEVIQSPAQHADGLALDPQGRLIVAGYASRSVWRLEDGSMHVLADNQDGKKLNSPDDLIARSDGVIYFTDPTFGLAGGPGMPMQTAELDSDGVYRIDTDGSLHLEQSSQDGPNGVELSPDEQILYVSYTTTGEIHAFAVQPDGALSDDRVLVSGALGADSMCVDSDGNLYVATIAGISIYAPSGAPLGTIAVPDWTSNVAFGGSDQRTLFITARGYLVALGIGSGSLYRIDDMPIAGLPGRP